MAGCAGLQASGVAWYCAGPGKYERGWAAYCVGVPWPLAVDSKSQHWPGPAEAERPAKLLHGCVMSHMHCLQATAAACAWAMFYLPNSALQVLQSFPWGLYLSSCHLDSFGHPVLQAAGSWRLPAPACRCCRCRCSTGLPVDQPAAQSACFPTDVLPAVCLQDMHGTVTSQLTALPALSSLLCMGGVWMGLPTRECNLSPPPS